MDIERLRKAIDKQYRLIDKMQFDILNNGRMASTEETRPLVDAVDKLATLIRIEETGGAL